MTMPATTTRQRTLAHLFSLLKKRYAQGEPEPRPVLEQFVYAICREGTTRERADRAYRALCERFFDWNEIRVSSDREVEEALGDLPDAGARAQRLLSFLQEVFDTTFSYDLEPLQKKGLKQAAKQIGRFQAANDFVVAWITQQSLEGHAVPVDEPGLRTLRRMGLVDEDQSDGEALRTSLEHLVPKARASSFGDAVSALADEFCLADQPRCGVCPMADECPGAREAPRTNGTLAGRTARPKPR